MLGAEQLSQRRFEPAADWSRLHGASGVDNHRRTPAAALGRSLLCRRRGVAQ